MLDCKGENYQSANVQDSLMRSSYQPKQFCVMRIGKKYYSLETVEALEYHMERQGAIENADSTKSKDNRILIGDANIYDNLEKLISGIWRRKDSAIARDGILTASPSFFKNISKEDFEKWLELNVKWLENTFNNNCIYAVLHMDETTPHIHFVTSLIYTNDKGKQVMSDKHYFGSKQIMSDLQSNYAGHIQSTFKGLSRGLKGSRACHISIKQYYELCARKLDMQDKESVMAKAKNNELLEIKLGYVKKTLETFENCRSKEEQERKILEDRNIQLFDNLVKAKQNEKLFNETLKAIEKIYNIPPKEIIKIVDKVKEKVIEKEL